MPKVFTITEGLENMGALKSGGQGSVYKARRMGPIITAVKLLPTPIHSESGDDKHFTDFQNEVAKLKKVNEQPNPNVVKILSSGITESGSLPYIEMEYIEGPDLEELLKPPHDPVFTLKEVIKVAEHLSHALAHCHKLGIRHGDIKSNNVKWNRDTGNYVLLDFGLAIMTDEERRTSLRRAGAIEFMAPEQNEGTMLFQTDVYSFGVIIYELFTGRVPFPLNDKGETARNQVMVAHMEQEVPDALALRRSRLPASWSEEKKEREMNVPDWLVALMRKCLEKHPAHRFADGRALHDYIVLHSISFSSNIALQQKLGALQAEVDQLRMQNRKLQEQAAQRPAVAARPPVTEVPYPAPYAPARPRRSWLATAIPFLLSLGVLLVVAYFIQKGKTQPETTSNEVASNVATDETPRNLGQYKVVASRAHFHNEPDESTRRQAYMIPSNEVLTAFREDNDFIYTEFTNHKGQTSKGWLRKEDVVPLSEWTKQTRKKQLAARPREEDLQLQLNDAATLLEAGEIESALGIYSYLSQLEVPEAMYHYGNLALKGQNAAIDCDEAMMLLRKASDKKYTPAKSSLGYLYVFAKNKDILRMKGYDDHCKYERNIVQGGRLLVEAMMAGDTAAKRVLDDVNLEVEGNPFEEREE